MFLKVILNANHSHSSGSNGNRDFYHFGQLIILKLVHIIAHPLTSTKYISILFAVIRQKILTQVSIKTWRAIFTTGRIIKWSSFRKSFLIKS